MSSGPINALAAIAVALLPLPAMKALDYFNRGCGDGSCGLWSGVLVLGGLAIVSVVFLVRSARRQETPAALRLVVPLLWLLALVPSSL